VEEDLHRLLHQAAVLKGVSLYPRRIRDHGIELCDIERGNLRYGANVHSSDILDRAGCFRWQGQMFTCACATTLMGFAAVLGKKSWCVV